MSYTKTFQVNAISLPAVFDATLSAIAEIGWKITGGNSTGTLVVAKTGFSFRSSGETVNVVLRELESGVVVEVRSTCKWQLSSWGKNASNVARLHQSIGRHLVPATDKRSVLPEIYDETHEQSGDRVRSPRKYCCNCGAALEPTMSAEKRASSTQEIKCSVCGESVSAEAFFCPFCGACTRSSPREGGTRQSRR